MNHDATHCADWNKRKCPKSCYRAALTEELEERSDLWYLPISYSHFAGSIECKRKDGDGMAEYNANEFFGAERKAKPFGDGISCCPVCGAPTSIGKHTNGDRIRAMSDEELAEYAYTVLGNYCCPPQHEYTESHCTKTPKCKDCWLDWLKQEVEHGDTDT